MPLSITPIFTPLPAVEKSEPQSRGRLHGGEVRRLLRAVGDALGDARDARHVPERRHLARRDDDGERVERDPVAPEVDPPRAGIAARMRCATASCCAFTPAR